LIHQLIYVKRKEINKFMPKKERKEILTVPIEDIHVDPERYKATKESYDEFLNSTAHLHFFKCQDDKCLLEFMVLSWKSDWSDKYSPYCPECGQQKAGHLRSVSTNEPIYKVVYSDKFEEFK
jgi:hypothetical protein